MNVILEDKKLKIAGTITTEITPEVMRQMIEQLYRNAIPFVHVNIGEDMDPEYQQWISSGQPSKISQDQLIELYKQIEREIV